MTDETGSTETTDDETGSTEATDDEIGSTEATDDETGSTETTDGGSESVEATDEGSESAEAADGSDPLVQATRGASFVESVLENGVATVMIDRPSARNALNEQLRGELIAAFDAVAESDARVVVLTGSDAAGAFVAGADVTELRERSVVEQRAASQPPRVYETIADCPVPVIAKIDGHALGGGCEVALACDLRVASEEATLGQPEITLGLIPGGGGTQRLPRLVGTGEALRLICSGELIDGRRAAEIGLVEECVPADEVDETVAELAESIAVHSPLAVRRATEAVRAAEQRPLREGIAYERELFVGLFDSHDTNEGIDAFLNDREPEWRGE